MEKGSSIEKISEKIDYLIDSIDKLQKDNEVLNKDEILESLLAEQASLRKKLAVSKQNEREIIERVQKYERLVQRALSDREKNIKYLQNRVTVLEQSFPTYVSKRMQKGLKEPISLPKELFNVSKAAGGAVKRKVTKKKRNYKKIKLPYAMTKVSSITDRYILDREKIVTRKINELFLMGLFNNPKKLSDFRVAAILDTFSYETFKHDADLITFKPDNWYEVLTKKLPHMLLVESAWQGNGGSWQYKIAKYNIDQGPELDDLLKWCKQNDIPTVFWNKEDPVHFDRFINTASKFDFIFTSDENCVEKYKEVTGNENVYSMSFAAQPVIHNPIKVPNYKKNSISFAGSYYANRHEKRRIEQEKLLEAAIPHGLVIFDRNYNKENINPHMQYPDKFQDNIQGALPYNELVKVYKQFKVFLNVNSVKDSPTMFSRRVYELLACGTSLVTTSSVGINQLFGDVVTEITDMDESGEKINSIMQDEHGRRKNEMEGIRRVFGEHTYAHRLHRVAKLAGFNIEKPYNYKVLIISKAESIEDIEKLKQTFNNQEYNQKALIIINATDEKLENENGITFIDAEEISQEIEITIKEISSNYDLIGSFNPNHFYGKHYLTDIVNGFVYSEGDAVGKGAYYEVTTEGMKENNQEMEYSYINFLANDAFLIKSSILKEFNLSFMDLIKGAYNFNLLNSYGIRSFAVDKYNFLVNGSTDLEIDITTIEL